MKLPNNGDDRAPTGHLLSSNEDFSTGSGAKGSHRNTQIIQAVAKTAGCSPQTDDKV